MKGSFTGQRTKTCGVTSHGNGHLYLCERHNGCVQMYTLDGRCLGILIGKGGQGLGEPQWIQWCSGPSSFIVAHAKGGRWQISVVEVR